MNGRIILSQADFSANNIGQYVELSDLTKKVLAKQTLYDEASQQAGALNTFLSGLTLNGFIGGESPILNYLILPVLAANDDQLLYSIAELDEDGYPTDKRSDAEKSAVTKAYQRYIVNDVVKGLHLPYLPGEASVFANQRDQTINNFFTKGAAYPSMTECLWCPKVTTYASDSISVIGGGYAFKIAHNIAGLISTSSAPRYLKFSIDNIGAGFIGVSYDAANNQFETMFDNGTAGELESLDASNIKQSTYDSYNKLQLGANVNDAARQFAASAVAFGNKMTSTQMTQFRTLLANFLTSLNVI